MQLTGYLWVALGGALGACLRHGVGQLSLRVFGPGFPVGTFSVNIIGSLLMGLLTGWLLYRSMGDHDLRLFLAVGGLGGFTTFSAFALDSVNLWERGQMLQLGVYALGSVLLSILAVFAGLALARSIWP